MEREAYCIDRILEPGTRAELTMDRHCLIHALRGSVRLEAEGRRWSLTPPRAALLAAGKPIRMSVASRLHAASALFAPGFVPAPRAALSVLDMTPLARELMVALRGHGPEGGALPAAAARMFAVLGDVVLGLARAPSPWVLPAPTDERLARAMAIAEASLENLPSFAEIARESGQSTRSLTRRCAEELGTSWRDLIRRMRMIRAAEMLATGTASITEIAVTVGYTSPSGFNEAFREMAGQSPTEYRAALRVGYSAAGTSAP